MSEPAQVRTQRLRDLEVPSGIRRLALIHPEVLTFAVQIAHVAQQGPVFAVGLVVARSYNAAALRVKRNPLLAQAYKNTLTEAESP